MNKFLTLAFAAAMATVPATSIAQDAPHTNEWAGHWIASPESRFTDGAPLYNQVYILPDNTVYIYDIYPNGKTVDWHYTPVEGQFVSVVGRDGFKVKIVHTTPHRIDSTWMNPEGKVVAQAYAELSADGKTQTFHAPTELVIFHKTK